MLVGATTSTQKS